MRILLLISVLFCLVMVSCEDERDEDVIIKTGRDCGWCGGSDSLVLTVVNSHYEFRNSCDQPPDKNKDAKTDRAKWNELLATLNWEGFKKVKVNTCALCADGCDTWILVEMNKESHEIRFTENSPEIESIRAFVENLYIMHQEFRNN